MWAYEDLGIGLAAILMMAVNSGGDAISGDVGDDGRGVTIGKGINQDNQRYDQRYDGRQNVNIYTNANDDHHYHAPYQPLRSLSLEDRIERIELYVYGDGMSIPGILRQQNEIIRQQAEIVKRQSEEMAWIKVLTASLVIVTLVVTTLFIMAGG
jgi:hypothetical protein